MAHHISPPPSPPSPDTETKPSRKREREVSVEPVSTPKPSIETDAVREHKETRTPAKKNRTQLDATEEEEDTRSNSGSPPLSESPPHEIKVKVRQISQGVEDISWQNTNAAPRGEDPETNQVSKQAIPDEDKLKEPCASEPVDSQETTTVSTSLETDNVDKTLKRKLADRGASQGPPDCDYTAQIPPEPLKRPRDDTEKDDNPRETKRPSPPPEPKSPKSPKKAAAPVTPKPSGFMAYASTSSPFAAVKGQNIFASSKATSPPPPPLPLPSTTAPASPPAIFGQSPAEASSSSTLTPALKRSGFEAFASRNSPFSSTSRSKSPVSVPNSHLERHKSPSRRTGSHGTHNSTAFSSYASGVQSFAIPAPKRARAGSPSGSSRSSVERTPGVTNLRSNGAASDSGAEDDKEDGLTFGEKLRAGKDDEDESRSDEEQGKYTLTEQEVITGEEDEQTVHQVRGKLFSLVGGNQWQERGTGTLKLNVKRLDGSGARLVMRKEAVYTLLLNVTLFQGMRCSLAQDPRYLRFSVIEDGATTHYNLRLASAKIAMELLDEITANIPFT